MTDFSDTKYARDIGFPFRFTDDCDLLVDEDEEVVDQAVNLIAFIRKGSVLLFDEMGSPISLAVFDPLDDESELIIDTALRQSFEKLEPRVFLDKEFIFDESADESTLIIIVPYYIKVTRKLAASRLTVDRPLTTG